jgi:hypothetical protein
MGTSRIRRIHTLGLHEQAAWMRREHPGFNTRIESGRLVTRGVVQPSELHNAYQVRVEYRVWDPPKAMVEEPKLQRREPDERIPHTYQDPDDTERPCLYLPQNGEWSPDKKLALTVIPWLSVWFIFYETWRVTGEWLGDGVHPTQREPIVRRPITWSPIR